MILKQEAKDLHFFGSLGILTVFITNGNAWLKIGASTMEQNAIDIRTGMRTTFPLSTEVEIPKVEVVVYA